MKKSIFSFTSKICYLTANAEHYFLDKQRNYCKAPQDAKPLVLVLSRYAYQEEHLTFPIAKERDLKKILQQRSKQLQYFYIGPYENGQRRVVIITPHANLVPCCLAAKLVIPITVLVSAQPITGLIDVIAPDGRFFLLKNSTTTWQSVTLSSLIPDANKALQLLGGVQHAKQASLSLATLLHAWLSLRLLKPAAIFPGLQLFNATKNTPLVPFMLLTMLAIALYMAAGSKFLLWQLEQGAAKQQQAMQQAEPILQQTEQLSKMQSVIATVQNHTSNAVNAIAVWELFAQAALNEATINNAQNAGLTMYLQGNAKDATQFLQLLLAQPFVANAYFTAPTMRNNQGQQQYSIALELKPISDRDN